MSKKNLLPDRLDTVDFFALFSHMQEHPEAPESKRVDRVLELLTYLGCVEAGFKVSDGRRIPRFADGPTRFRVMDTLSELRTILAAYQWTKDVHYSRDGFRVDTYPGKRGLSRESEWEYKAISDLLDLAGYPNALSRIRKCDVCGKWLFDASRPGKQRFCSGRCKQYKYDNDPVRQEQHRANMRRLYRLEKSLVERAKAAVAIRTRKGKSLR